MGETKLPEKMPQKRGGTHTGGKTPQGGKTSVKNSVDHRPTQEPVIKRRLNPPGGEPFPPRKCPPKGPAPSQRRFFHHPKKKHRGRPTTKAPKIKKPRSKQRGFPKGKPGGAPKKSGPKNKGILPGSGPLKRPPNPLVKPNNPPNSPPPWARKPRAPKKGAPPLPSSPTLGGPKEPPQRESNAKPPKDPKGAQGTPTHVFPCARGPNTQARFGGTPAPRRDLTWPKDQEGKRSALLFPKVGLRQRKRTAG